MPKVNPLILQWARESAGLTLEDAAEKVGLKLARGTSGAERLAMLEAGRGEPSRPLLLKMANQYRRPLLTFYLAAPPAKAARGEDFRRYCQVACFWLRRDEAAVFQATISSV